MWLYKIFFVYTAHIQFKVMYTSGNGSFNGTKLCTLCTYADMYIAYTAEGCEFIYMPYIPQAHSQQGALMLLYAYITLYLQKALQTKFYRGENWHLNYNFCFHRIWVKGNWFYIRTNMYFHMLPFIHNIRCTTTTTYISRPRRTHAVCVCARTLSFLFLLYSEKKLCIQICCV